MLIYRKKVIYLKCTAKINTEKFGSGSGSVKNKKIFEKMINPDPDPNPYIMYTDPQHCFTDLNLTALVFYLNLY